MTRRHDIDPLDGLRVPGPPVSLERQVLTAAAAALRHGTRATVWDRLWQSRPLRVAWTVAVVGLLSAHAAMTFSPSRPGRAVPGATGRPPSAELRELIALPSVEISPRAEAIALERALSATQPARPTSKPDDRDEKNEVPS